MVPGAAVVSVGHRLAPEHPFHAPLEGLAVRALASDGRAFALAGDRAGGNLAAVISRRLRDEHGPRPRAQPFAYPVCDSGLDTRSADDLAESHGVTRAAMRRFWDWYLDGADGRLPDAPPLRRHAGTVHGFWRWYARTETSVRAIGGAGAFLRGAPAR